MSKTVPATPDYVGAAQQTAQSSAATTEAQTVANRPNVNTPWSSQTWNATPTWDPTTGTYVNQWTQNTNLVPGAQSALNSQISAQGKISDTANTLAGQENKQATQPLDWSSFQSLGGPPQAQQYQTPNLQSNIGYTPNLQGNIQGGNIQQSLDTSGLPQVGTSNSYANNAANAAFQQYQNRNLPLQQQATNQQMTQLYNQGLRPGDAAYDTAIKNLQNQQSDANTQASLGATQFGIQGGQIMQGQDLANNQNQFGQRSATGAFANNAAAQTLNQNQTLAGFGNTVQQQNFQNAGTGATFANSAAQSTLQNQLATGAQTYGQQMGSANYQDQMRQQQISEDLTQRGFTTNEINAMLTGQQVQTGPSPQFNASGAAQPTNYSTAAQNAYGGAVNAANVQNSATSNTVGDAAGIAAAFF